MAKRVTMSGEAATPRPIKVRAIQVGYYGECRRRVGDVFTIKGEQEFSTRWMERVPEDTVERTTGPNASIRRATADVLGQRQAGLSPGILTTPDDVPDDIPDTGRNPLGA